MMSDKLQEFFDKSYDEQMIALNNAVMTNASGLEVKRSYCIVDQTENYYIIQNEGKLEAIPIEQASIVAISIIR